MLPRINGLISVSLPDTFIVGITVIRNGLLMANFFGE